LFIFCYFISYIYYDPNFCAVTVKVRLSPCRPWRHGG